MIIVVPYLSEISTFFSRKMEAGIEKTFISPEKGADYNSKTEALIDAITMRHSIITTQALFEKLRSFKHLEGLTQYELWIDEVPESVEKFELKLKGSGINRKTFLPYVTVSEGTNELRPTELWYKEKHLFSPDDADDNKIIQAMHRIESGSTYLAGKDSNGTMTKFVKGSPNRHLQTG